LSGGRRSGRTPWGCLARRDARVPEVVKVNNTFLFIIQAHKLQINTKLYSASSDFSLFTS
jgi:hypothetical protein